MTHSPKVYQRHSRTFEIGLSLISTVTAISVTMIIISMFSSHITGFFQMQKWTLQILTPAQINELIVANVDCAKTLPNGLCTPEQAYSIYRAKTGTVLVNSSGTNFGSFKLQAECISSGFGLMLNATYKSFNGNLKSTRLTPVGLNICGTKSAMPSSIGTEYSVATAGCISKTTMVPFSAHLLCNLTNINTRSIPYSCNISPTPLPVPSQWAMTAKGCATACKFTCY